MENDNKKNIFNLKGIYLPTEVFMNKKLDRTCLILFELINYLDDYKKHCWASNGYFAKLLGVSTTTISTSISLLNELGYININIYKHPLKGHQRIINIASDYKSKHKDIANLMSDRYKALLNDFEYDDKNIYIRPLKNFKKGLNKNLKEIEDKSLYEIKGDEGTKELASKEANSKADALPFASNKTILHKRSNGKLLMNAKLKVDKPLKAKKPIKPYQPTEKALDLIEFWEGKGLKSISHNPETKTYWQSLIAFDKLLSGKAFNSTEYKSYEGKKFTLAEARKAISRFALMALNSDYEPRNVKFKSDLSKISPADFIFNAYVSSNGYGRSKFIHCHENEAKIIREKDVYVEDKYPNVTKAIMNKYKKDILGGSEIQFTNDDLNAFRKAANFAHELFAKNQNRLLGTYAQLKPYQIAESMFEALERSGADFAKVKPHWLCNSAMQKQLPAYLYQAAILQDRTCEGQQQVHYYDFGRPFSE